MMTALTCLAGNYIATGLNGLLVPAYEFAKAPKNWNSFQGYY
jgi:hypothetical protein